MSATDPLDLDADALFADVERIAALGPRFCGTPGELAARDLLTLAFVEAGLIEVRHEPFPMLAYVPGGAACTTGDGGDLPCAGLEGTAAGEATGEAVFLGEGTREEIAAATAAGIDLRGRVVVVRTGLLFPVAERLAGLDIAALVHVGETPDGLVGHYTATFYPPPTAAPWPGRVLPFPGVSVEARAGGRLLAALVAGPVRVTVRHNAAYVEHTAANVVGELPGRERRGEVVVVGAHYDTQRESPGASDNATGLAALLAVARRFRGLELPRTVRFVAFAAEEPAAWGAAHHVRSGDPASMAGMVNFDALGPPMEATRTVVATPDLLDDAVACAARTGWHAQATVDARAFPYTDNAPFAEAGVPTCLLWRYPPSHPYYHSAGDVPAHVDPTRLAQDARAGAAVALWLALRHRDPKISR